MLYCSGYTGSGVLLSHRIFVDIDRKTMAVDANIYTLRSATYDEFVGAIDVDQVSGSYDRHNRQMAINRKTGRFKHQDRQSNPALRAQNKWQIESEYTGSCLQEE